MKLLLMKLSSLLLLLLAAYLLVVTLGIVPGDLLETKLMTVLEQAPPQVTRIVTTQLITTVVLIFSCVVSFIAFIPGQWRKRPLRHITFTGDHGDVVIQLDPVQQSLTRVMLNMPEIRKVQLKVDPDESGRNAVIHADVIIQNQPGINARDTARTVTDYIAESAKSLMGLEDLGNIRLNITGINLNPKKSSRVVRAEHEIRKQPQAQLAYTAPASNAGQASSAVEPMITPAYEPVDVVANSSVEAPPEERIPEVEPMPAPVVEEEVVSAPVAEEMAIEPMLDDTPALAPLKMDDIDEVELPPLAAALEEDAATADGEVGLGSMSFKDIADNDDDELGALPPYNDDAATEEEVEETLQDEIPEAVEEVPAEEVVEEPVKKKKKGWGLFG